MKTKNLTKKEKLFCLYFSSLRNAREAAALSGYILPKKSGGDLLERAEIRREIEKVSKSYPETDEIKSGFRRLAFSSPADGIKLIFKEDISDEEIEKFDLYNISEIKKAKNGNIEIKFFDRLKALEKLGEIENDLNTGCAEPFYDAIRKGASAIGKIRNEE